MIDDSATMRPVCDACEYPATDLKEYDMVSKPVGNRSWACEKKTLCELCASTASGSAFEYPSQYEGQKETLFALCFLANTILDAIKKK